MGYPGSGSAFGGVANTDGLPQILTFVSSQKLHIIEDTDGSSSKTDPDAVEKSGDLEDLSAQPPGPSSDAMAKFTDYSTSTEHSFPCT